MIISSKSPSVNLSVCKSAILSVCISHISQTFHTTAFALGRYVARVPIMCTVLYEVDDASKLYIFMSFCAVHSLTFTFYRPPCAGYVLVARWRSWAPGGQYITKEANLVSVCEDGLATPTNSTGTTGSSMLCCSYRRYVQSLWSVAVGCSGRVI